MTAGRLPVLLHSKEIPPMTHHSPRPAWPIKTFALTLALLLTACGGGGGDNASFPLVPTPPASNASAANDTAQETLPASEPPITPTCAAAVPANAPLKAISAVQGTGDISPLLNQTVTVRGVVVGDFQNTDTTTAKLDGFFVQHLDPDADPMTSEGIFVYTSKSTTRVAVGDFVQVSGVVAEFGQTASAGAKPTASRRSPARLRNPPPSASARAA